MLAFNLDTLQTASAFVKICERYTDLIIDVGWGRYIVDGKSALGVMALIGNIVRVEVVNWEKYPEQYKEFVKELERYGREHG